MLKLTFSTLLVLFCLVSTTLAQQPMQDVVYLKDGSVIRGMIVEQVPNVSVKIQTREGNVFVYKMENIQKMTKEPIRGMGMGQMSGTGQKSPALAFVLSFLVPGVGQYYNGEVAKGIIQEAAFVGGLVLYIQGVNDYDDTLQAIGGFDLMAAWIWSMIDAPLSANRINRGLQSFGHLIEFNHDPYALGVDVAPGRKGMNAKLTLHF